MKKEQGHFETGPIYQTQKCPDARSGQMKIMLRL